MPAGRPDYTGSIVIEDIENVTAVITIVGSVVVSSITGTVNVSVQNLTLAVTQSGAWSVTITGSVTVTGTVAISGSVTVTGTVAISGSVTITGSVTVSGSVTVTGTANINITSQSAALIIDMQSGFRHTILTEEGQTSTSNNENMDIGSAATANTDFVTFNVYPETPTTYDVVAMLIPEAATTWNILRDGVSIATGSASIAALTIGHYLDENVPAGTHEYALQIANSCDCAAALFTVDELMNVEHNTSSGTNRIDNVAFDFTSAITSASITTTETGTVHVLIAAAFNAGVATTLTLKRDTTTLAVYNIGSGYSFQHLLYEDASLPAGTYTYTTTLGLVTAQNVAIALVSDGTTSIPILITPYLQNLNIGLDTRASEATLAALEVHAGTLALEAGGNLADIKTAVQIIDDMDLKKWGGTTLTGRDISTDLSNLPTIVSNLLPQQSRLGLHTFQRAGGGSAVAATDLDSYTVPANKTLYVTQIAGYISYALAATRLTFYASGNITWAMNAPIAGVWPFDHSFLVPLKVATGGVVKFKNEDNAIGGYELYWYGWLE